MTNPTQEIRQAVPLDDALAALRRGRMLLLIDHVFTDRGGVVVAPAERTSDDVVNFMATHARGLVAVSIPHERLERLGLELQAPFSKDLSRENYTVSVEARVGVSTGISALDRARTIQALGEVRTTADDLVTPGHVFPAAASPEGVLARRGWAEATADLGKAAGLSPCMTFCHVLDDHGEVAIGASLDALAENHGLVKVRLADVVAHRLSHESFATQQTQASLPTGQGEFLCRVFVNQLDEKEHLALTVGEVRSAEPVLVRLHSECLTGDVFHSLRCDCGDQLRHSMESIQSKGRGVILYLQQEGRGIGIVNKVNAYRLQDTGRDTVEANLDLGFDADVRDFGIGAQMLMALGVQRVRLMTNNPRKVAELEAYGIEVVERVGLEFEPHAENEAYLRAKKEKLGHLLELV
jgi:3,4-dihydroxy 2-butanone 4-phosphate synthase/GTP cyclohydrolase II